MNTSLNDFFDDVTIFITGGTGFIGKVLIEKLLRSQTNIRRLYLLIRTKKGKSGEERAQEYIFNKPIFEQLRQTQPNFMEKVGIVSGDITEPELGLSENDKRLIFNEVNIVFNCAASTNMNISLRDSVRYNVTSVIEMMNLCRKIKNLKSVVVASTAYSNSNLDVIEEKIYKSPISPELAFKLCAELDDSVLTEITPLILHGQPNTYTFSKSLLENVLMSYSDLPIVLYRPAIVVASYREPLPGWVDSINGPTGLLYAAGMGIIRVFVMDSSVKNNWVPVDMCTNAMIVSSWHGIRARLLNSDKIPTYNYAFNKKAWALNKYTDFMSKTGIKLNQAVWKNGAIILTNPLQYAILKFFLHTIPIFFIDALLALYGHPLRLSKIFNEKVYPTQDVFNLFMTKEWTFKEDNVDAMWMSLTKSEKKQYFFDSNSMSMQEWLRAYCVGIKVFIAKESMEDNHIAVRRHQILTVIHYIFLFVLFSGLLWISIIIFKCFQ